MKTKKILSVLLTIVMVVSVMTTMSISASAETAPNVGGVNFTQALDSSFVGGALESNNYYLSENLTLTQNITVAGGKTVKICLNGCVLNLNGHYIENSGDLSIYDNSAKYYRFTPDTNGLWIPNEGGSLAIQGGYIIGGTGKTVGSYTYGGAVYNYGTLTLNGGSIVGNTADRGGAVFLDKNGSVFTMNAGGIIGNTSTNEGAGVYVHNGATFTMNAGSISNNCVINNAKGGGGVYTHGTFIMNCGNINSNKAKSGAGVYVYYYNDANHPGEFKMTSNGIIRLNTASDKGGGVYVDDNAEVLLCGDITGNTAGTMAGGVCCNTGITVGGDLYMENNKVGTTESNLVLRNDNKAGKITVSTETPLSEDAYIGLTRLDANKQASGGVVSTNGTENDVQYFYSDVDDYTVKLVGGVLTLSNETSDNECHLDLDSTTTDIKDSRDLDQNYNLKVNESVSKADEVVTKVKLSWEIKDINATRTDDKIWDTENLCWKTDTSSTTINQKGTAKFTLENYSSVKVDAKVTFDTAEYEEGKKFAAPTLIYNEGNNTAGTDDGKITLDTANGNSTYSKTNVPTGEINVTVTPDNTDTAFKTLTATTSAKKYGTYTITIEEYQEPACIVSGSMVTLADGTKKVIDDITMNDTLMTYNFFTGEIEGNKPMYILENNNILSSVITLSFSDGSKLEMCDEQSFFDMDARDYFLISRQNYQNALGKNIMQIKDGKIETVTITNISLEKKYCTSYELATENGVNFVANDIINTPPDYFLPGTYTFGEDMKIDAEQYQKDVEKYGLYTYAEFEKYFSEDFFVAGHIADVKIAIGKGLFSEKELFAYYEAWIPVIQDTNK